MPAFCVGISVFGVRVVVTLRSRAVYLRFFIPKITTTGTTRSTSAQNPRSRKGDCTAAYANKTATLRPHVARCAGGVRQRCRNQNTDSRRGERQGDCRFYPTHATTHYH